MGNETANVPFENAVRKGQHAFPGPEYVNTLFTISSPLGVHRTCSPALPSAASTNSKLNRPDRDSTVYNRLVRFLRCTRYISYAVFKTQYCVILGGGAF